MSCSADAPFDLERFVIAQEPVFSRVRSELEQGEKRSHWMWFVFPQLRGLGASAMSHRFAIASLQEAQAYLAHAVLGPRLVQCTTLVIQVEGRSIEEIFGHPDDLKFRSCMTLFATAAAATTVVAPASPGVFQAALDKYFDGVQDPATRSILMRQEGKDDRSRED